jgi:hypothetical protein
MEDYGMRFARILPCMVFSILCSCSPPPADISPGTLHVSEINPRYFTDQRGKAVYLTGSHTWNNLVDMVPEGSDGPGGSDGEFDYPAYIRWMKEYHHNFMRLWRWELLNWDTRANNEDAAKIFSVSPHPWMRTGPGNALDGKPRFDPTKPDPLYYERLAQRVKLAADSGIYLSIMLFEGCGRFKGRDHRYGPSLGDRGKSAMGMEEFSPGSEPAFHGSLRRQGTEELI